MKKDILSMSLDELTIHIITLGEKRFRAQQIYKWLHVKRVRSFSEMSDLSVTLREKLDTAFEIKSLTLSRELTSTNDGTRKFLFMLPNGLQPDNEYVETVFMVYKHAFSLCISSQVGCKMGCSFCASGISGFVRNLLPSEMLLQVYEAERLTGQKIGSLVMMGIGEPLDNFDNTVRFLKLISDEHGKNLSARHISLSTCGIVPRIYDLAKLRLGLTLSVSLHQADDRRRSEIMPVNNAYNITELMTACRDYIETTGRRISFEYAVADGVNDSREDADKLIKLLRGMNCHVNLIPVNRVEETAYIAKRDTVRQFQKYLEDGKLGVTVRRTLGSDINAACGQLRNSQMEANTVKQS